MRLFFDHVQKTDDGCWLWTSSKVHETYGKLTRKYKTYYAHRYIYEYMYGKIPADKELDHLCENKSCVNPSHLEVVTHSENRRRGKISGGVINSERTHCINGHEWNEENIYRIKNRAICKICIRTGPKRRIDREERQYLELIEYYKTKYGLN